MPTLKTASRSATHRAPAKPRKAAAASSDTSVLALLMQDHRDVKKLFTAYQKLADQNAPAPERRAVAEQICAALTVHATVEEELFYPALREASDDAQDELDEAQVEHASVKELVAQIQAMNPGDALYDAKLKVLGEYVTHHVKEEEGEMFPKARKADLDLDALGERVQARKAELQGLALH